MNLMLELSTSENYILNDPYFACIYLAQVIEFKGVSATKLTIICEQGTELHAGTNGPLMC